ncbi:MAG: lactonase family protein [Chloroflexota bacterium]
MKLYVGTYTRPAPYLAATNGKGLYVCEVDEATGALEIEQEVPGIENPSYLCISPDGRNLHAVWEVFDWPEGLISSYRIDPESGRLSYQGVHGTRGTVACYVMMDSQSRVALVANYWSGTVTLFPARRDGALSEAADVVQHTGSGPNEARQEGPHAHSIVVAPGDRFAIAADLGADQLVVYRLDLGERKLIQHTTLDMPAGSGPRHFAFAPNGRTAYVICELDSTMATLAWDAGTGTLTYVDRVAMLPEGVDHHHSHCADLAVHPTGRFVYGSNRGHDSITMFRADPDTGRLTLLAHRSTEGKTPRNFTLTPDGRFLLVANQDSDTVVTMPIDPVTGLLGETASVAQVPSPNCVRFAP